MRNDASNSVPRYGQEYRKGRPPVISPQQWGLIIRLSTAFRMISQTWMSLITRRMGGQPPKVPLSGRMSACIAGLSCTCHTYWLIMDCIKMASTMQTKRSSSQMLLAHQFTFSQPIRFFWHIAVKGTTPTLTERHEI